MALRINILALLALSLVLSSCDGFFGKKSKYEDLISPPSREPRQPAYVPIAPIITAHGRALVNPIYVCAGLDNLYYVIDSVGANSQSPTRLLAFDESGSPSGEMPLPDSILLTTVVQDRKLDLLATGRLRRTFSNGSESTTHWLPAIFRISLRQQLNGAEFININTARITKMLVYPYFIRELNRLNFSDSSSVLGVNLTGIGIMPDNRYYVTSSSKFRERASLGTNFPNNSIMTCLAVDTIFTPINVGGNVNYFERPQHIVSTLLPPQNTDNNLPFPQPEWENFIWASASPDFSVKVQFIEAITGPEGKNWQLKDLIENDFTQADGFLYTSNRFKNPQAITMAGDNTRYIWVADRDSVFQFTSTGLEGAIPPAGSRETKNIKVSFGGHGDGLLQFNRIKSLAYARRTLWVADAGNKRIMRYKLTNDLD